MNPAPTSASEGAASKAKASKNKKKKDKKRNRKKLEAQADAQAQAQAQAQASPVPQNNAPVSFPEPNAKRRVETQPKVDGGLCSLCLLCTPFSPCAREMDTDTDEAGLQQQ